MSFKPSADAPLERAMFAARTGGTIVLYGFGPFLGAPDSSPFVIKTMVLLKLAGLDYRVVRGNPLRAPKKLLPYIQDGGVTVADSTLIRSHLERTYGVDLDAGLSAEQRAVAWAVERLCEDHLYFAMLHARWMDRGNFTKGVGTMFGVIPAPVRPIAKVMLRRMNAARLHGHGLGRQAPSDRIALAVRDIDALAAILGTKRHVMGDAPCGADATVFAFVESILTPPLNDPLRSAMQSHDNLVAYRDRLTQQWFA